MLTRKDCPERMTIHELYEVVCLMADAPTEVEWLLANRVIAQSLKILLGTLGVQ